MVTSIYLKIWAVLSCKCCPLDDEDLRAPITLNPEGESEPQIDAWVKFQWDVSPIRLWNTCRSPIGHPTRLWQSRLRRVQESDRYAAGGTVTDWAPTTSRRDCRHKIRFTIPRGKSTPVWMGRQLVSGSFSSPPRCPQNDAGSLSCHRIGMQQRFRQIVLTLAGSSIPLRQRVRNQVGGQLATGKPARHVFARPIRSGCSFRGGLGIRDGVEQDLPASRTSPPSPLSNFAPSALRGESRRGFASPTRDESARDLCTRFRASPPNPLSPA
jgi:hypothetical protein